MVSISFVNGLCIGLVMLVVVAMLVWSQREMNGRDK